MSKHTPGPYRISRGCIVSDHPIENGPNGCLDKDYYGGYLIAESVAECNRAILAAAPRMLDSLKAALHHVRSIKTYSDEQAIPKAFAVTALHEGLVAAGEPADLGKIDAPPSESVWVMAKTVHVSGEDAQCWNCDVETPVEKTEIMGVLRLPAGTPFDLGKIRKHLVANYGDQFERVCFWKQHDITVSPEYLNE